MVSHGGQVILEVGAERRRQQEAEGWSLEHDDQHSVNGWVTLLTRYLGYAAHEAEQMDGDGYRKRLIQVAAITVAAIESYDRATEGQGYSGEHYLDWRR